MVAQADQSELDAALANGDHSAVARLAVEAHSTRIRQQAAQAITDPAQVLELLRLVRGKDKHVYRILAARRDAQLAAERAASERAAAVAATAEAVEKHAARAIDGSYGDVLARLEARWQQVAPDAGEDQHRAVAARLAAARERLAEHLAAQEAQVRRQAEAARAAEEARQAGEAQAQAAQDAAREEALRLESERNAERDVARARREAEESAAKEVLGLLRQTRAALDHGGTARAARLRDALAAKLVAAPPLPAWFPRTLQDLDARLAQLKDWNTFTVVPKRAQLLERMQSLVGAEMSPEELARQVRRLRDEWRSLHRGATEEEPAGERERFEELAEQAYAPARGHFAQQAEQRERNRLAREALLVRLQAFIDTQAQADAPPDSRAMQQVLGEARGEWREYAPVDQDVVKPLQERFHALLDQLRSRLDGEYARNAQARRDLIARAAQLADLADIRHAIDSAKSLQREWRTLGPVRRQDGDALWEEFRGHCDAVFQRSAHEMAAQGAAHEAAVARAQAICGEAEHIASLEGDALGDGLHRVHALHEEFDALELPRGAARDLRRRFERAVDACARARERLRSAEVHRGWGEAHAAADCIRAYADAHCQGASGGDLDGLRSAADEAVAGLRHAPKAARAALEAHWRAVSAGSISADRAANAHALRLLCVRAEIATGLESPVEDAELRREHQMRRLVATLGRGEHGPADEPEQLALEALVIGPVAPADEALHERLRRALAGT